MMLFIKTNFRNG